MNKQKKLFADAISLYVMSCILCQGIAVLHSKGTWTIIFQKMPFPHHCCLHLVYVIDDLKTHGTFFPIEPISLDDPFHPYHPDNNQPRKRKAGGAAIKRC